MEAVKRGGDRQKLHEVIRQASMEATARMKNGEGCDLISSLSAHTEFGMTEAEMNEVLKPSLYTGRCAEQVERYVNKLAPVLSQYEPTESDITI